MVKIIRYEVYVHSGDDWKLLDQFSSDERQNASFCAKEAESRGNAVKIIREVYETDDGVFNETVEYVGGLNNKRKAKPETNTLFDNLSGEYNVEATPLKMLASHQVSKAFIRLFAVVVFSLFMANIITSLSVPIVEFLVPEEQRRSVLFFGFFLIFLMFAGPLLFYKIPWNAFYSLHKDDKELIDERKLFRRATNLMRVYNLNDNGREVITPVFPEAPLEYKQYIIDYLTQILNHLSPDIKVKDSFNRLGIELIVYGGCLELSRYGHLVWAEANSLLYEAFKVLEGGQADLQAFYDAKRTYQDNKIAVFLTGVGAYLMAQVINSIPIDTEVLKTSLEKWISFNQYPETNTQIGSVEDDDEASSGVNIVFECLVNLKINVQIFDDEKDVGEKEQNAIKADIRRFISALATRNHGDNIIEEGNVTSIHFAILGKAISFMTAFLSGLEDYKERQGQYNLMVDAKTALIEVPSDKALNLNGYISDVLDYAYNQEIIVNDVIKDELLESPYAFEFLGNKKLRRSGLSASLYKMSF